MFCSGSVTRGARNVPIPLLPPQQLRPTGLSKDTAVSATFSNLNSPVRGDFLALWDGPWANETGHVWAYQERGQYSNLLECSNFTFAPRGLGTTSYRMYEVNTYHCCFVPGRVAFCARQQFAMPVSVRMHLVLATDIVHDDCSLAQLSVAIQLSHSVAFCSQALQLGTVPVYVW